MGLFERFRRKSSAPLANNANERSAPTFDAVDQVRRYHHATKHSPMRYARGPHGLNWETQPDPFRRYAGAPLLQFSLDAPRREVSFDATVQEGELSSQPFDETSLSELFRYALGLSAWKEYEDSRWALRVNPSSGNLHPTEGYVLCGPVPDLHPTGLLAHYAPKEHGLEVRCDIPVELWQQVSAGLPEGAFFVGLSSVLWREEWKYGERAYRYCNHDVGHAIAALVYSAARLGWKVRMLDRLATEQIGALLGLSGFGEAEPEEPDALLAVFPGEVSDAPTIDEELVQRIGALPKAGKANQLSPDHLEWDAIYACAFASEKSATQALAPWPRLPRVEDPRDAREVLAHRLFLQRRSAQSMDGKSSMKLEDFLGTLARCMPTQGQVPFHAMPWQPRVHLVLFVHRVDGLEPGLYVLLREEQSGARLRGAMYDAFLWESPEGVPASLPLYRLKNGAFKSVAAGLSCDQAIAGESAFSLGMLAEFDSALLEQGAWFYPRLFWETGLIGQVLYLEAEAAGLRGTGIGCFHDDPVHQQLGLQGSAFQSLYHFTIGGALEDKRLQTLAPYGEREPAS